MVWGERVQNKWIAMIYFWSSGWNWRKWVGLEWNDHQVGPAESVERRNQWKQHVDQSSWRKGISVGKKWQHLVEQCSWRWREQVWEQHLQYLEGNGWHSVSPGGEQGEPLVDLQPCPLQVFPLSIRQFLPYLCISGPSPWNTRKRLMLEVFPPLNLQFLKVSCCNKS